MGAWNAAAGFVKENPEKVAVVGAVVLTGLGLLARRRRS